MTRRVFPSNESRTEDLMMVLLLTSLLASAILYDPSRGKTFPVCLFHYWFDLPCPACGMTRSVCAFLKGRWGEAVGFHPLGPFAALLLIGVWLRGILLLWAGGARSRLAAGCRRAVMRGDEFLHHPNSIWLGLGLLIVVWIVRVGWLGWRDPIHRPGRLPFTWIISF